MIFFLLILLVGFLVPQHQANASLGCFISTSPLYNCVNSIVSSILQFVGSSIGFSASTMQSFINQSVFFPDQVYQGWKIMLNFVNMFFILVLIISAFGIIFDLQKYRTSVVGFLAAALFINFSFVIGTYIVRVGNGLANIFLKTIGDVSLTFAQGLSLNKIINLPALTPTGLGTFGLTLMAILFIILLIFALIAFISVAIFAIVRIPFIWFLLIISPIAWFGLALPNLRGQWSNWWKNFIGWTFFMPTYLFFMMFATIFINNRASISPTPAASGTTTTLGNISQLIGINDIFMFVVSLIFIIGGLGMAYKMTFLAGTKAAQYFGSIESMVKKNFPGSKTVRSMYAGAKATVQRIKQEGLPGKGSMIYGGERSEKLRASRWEQRFSRALGYTPDLKLQKQQVGDIDTEVNRLKDLERAGQITVDSKFQNEAFATDRNSVRGAAMRALLLEKGMITEDEFDKSMTDWTKTNPFLAQSMSERAAKGKYGAVKPDTLIDMAAAKPPYDKYVSNNARSARKEWFKHIQENDRALNSAKFDVDVYGAAIDIMGGRNAVEARDFQKSVSEKRPDIVGQYNARTDRRFRGNAAVAIHDIVKNKPPADVAKYLTRAWQDPLLQRALSHKIAKMNRLPPVRVRGRDVSPGQIFKSNLQRSVAHDREKLRIASGL